MSSDSFTIHCKCQIRMLQGQNFTSVRWKTQGGAGCLLVSIHGATERLPDMQCLPAARDRNAISSHEQWGGEHLLSNHLQPALLAKRCALDEEMAQLSTRPQGSSAGAAGLEFQTQICGLRNSGSLHQTSGFETGFCGSASGVLCKHFK